jgi:hypothetical protein
VPRRHIHIFAACLRYLFHLLLPGAATRNTHPRVCVRVQWLGGRRGGRRRGGGRGGSSPPKSTSTTRAKSGAARSWRCLALLTLRLLEWKRHVRVRLLAPLSALPRHGDNWRARPEAARARDALAVPSGGQRSLRHHRRRVPASRYGALCEGRRAGQAVVAGGSTLRRALTPPCEL